MDLRQLEIFEAVAEELSFTRAAERLYAAQSTVSAAVQSLEHELGATLFDRSTRRVSLTAVGEAVLAEARDAIDAVDRMRTAADESAAGLRGRVRVGMISNLGDLDLPDLFGDFHRSYPLVGLRLATSPEGSTGLLEDLARARVDVAFVGLPAESLVGLERIELLRTRFVALLPDGHPLADRRTVTLADLADEPFVDTPEGFGHRVQLDRAFAAADLARHVRTEVADLATVPGYVRTGLGVAIVPLMGTVDAPGVVTVEVDPHLEWSLHAVAPRHARGQPATARLLDLLQERAGRPPARGD
ncbi:LysR family transcriptional regulator [Luteimicrobium album]|uniref:LysR family transcriptional regulator n=1 Tax=Luteimicrobium album TaxID=1054550 RepID=A0ABQ6I8P6_9MICO|nr:LysR family transcriptional regulator [Luteimicrobium album]GMA26567.1 LysR family transcriptional regulator [Luteimicrobium album]